MDPLGKLQITRRLANAIGAVDEFKGRWEALKTLAPERLTALQRIATIESVGSSTRIEGVKLTDTEIDKLLSGLEIRSFRSRDEQEVAGYAELMELVFESWSEIPLTENHIRQLHSVLLKHSDRDERHRGQYKTLPNQVKAFDASGRKIGVVFETATPFDTPRLIADLTAWTRTALEAREDHPLLVIGAFVVRFLAIHPFQDGNGRLSRALTTLLLLRSGYLHVPFSSLERVVEESKDGYYRALRRAQSTLDGDESNLIVWLEYFLECLVRQKDELDRKLGQERVAAPLAPLSEQLVALVRERGRLTVREAARLTWASRNTIKDHLRRLVAAGHLAKRGQARGTWYERP